ncbi:MAG: 4Fe-4S dicluster domain-containing protein [archaeon]
MFPVLKEALKSIFKKPATLRYPFVKAEPPKAFRGRLTCDFDKCIHCANCSRVCPSGACAFNQKTKLPEFDLRLCIFCAECAEKCPVKIIALTNDYEMATTEAKDLMVKSAKLKPKPKK